MEVRICPKCGAENKDTNVTCSSCYASLEGGALAESRKKDEPTAAPQPRPSVERVTPVFNNAPAPIQKKSAPTGIVIALIIILGGALAGWWFFLRPAGPEQVVRRFAEASNSGDYQKIKPFLSKSTVSMIESMPGAEQGLTRGLQMSHKMKGDKASAGVKILNTTYEGGDNGTAIVEAEPLDKTGIPAGMDPKQEIVLVREGKEWKVDLMATMQRMMQKMFKGGMPGGFGRPPAGRPMRPGMAR